MSHAVSVPTIVPPSATSICERARHPNEVTVRFTRWTQFANTAYQRDQYAGFLRPQAEILVKAGRAVIVAG